MPSRTTCAMKKPLSTHPANSTFLILRPGALGDIILTLPAIIALRQSFPSGIVTLSAPPAAKELLDKRDFVDHFVSSEIPGLHTLFSPVCSPDPVLCRFLSSFDCVISYWADPDGMLERRMQECVSGRFIAHPPNPPDNSRTHVACHLLEPIVLLGAAWRPSFPLITPIELEISEGNDLLRSVGLSPLSRPVIIHPGSGSQKKNWPPECFAELAYRVQQRTSNTPVFVEGPADAAVAKTIRRDPRVQGYSWITCPGLSALIGLLSSARAYIGNDSGVSHLAGAVGTPSLVLFGPTDPGQWRPLGPSVRIVKKGPSMLSISVGLVLECFLDLLAHVQPPGYPVT